MQAAALGELGLTSGLLPGEAGRDLVDSTREGPSLAAQTVKNLPVVQETGVRSLGWEDALETEMAAHSSILAWRIPRDRGAWQPAVDGVTKSWTRLSN